MRLQEKLYYSIKEASEMVGVKEYVLRYWETEFTSIKPKRNAGKRIYTKNDINIICKIKYLLRKKGMTIKGVKNSLAKNSNINKTESSIEDITEHLKSLRDFLSGFVKDDA